MPPSPPDLKKYSDSQSMTWRVQAAKELVHNEVLECIRQVSIGSISVKVEAAGRYLTFVMGQKADGEYKELYDAFFKILLRLEEKFGEAVAIEGELRSRWNIQALLHRRFAR